MSDLGVIPKFIVKRADGDPSGKHTDCAYFVLDLECDEFAMEALAAYAKACRRKNPELADDLEAIVGAEPVRCGCREASCPHARMFGPNTPSEMAHDLMSRARKP